MVNAAQTFGIDPAAGHPERALALGYAPPERRDALAALFALDATLAKLARQTRDVTVAQMRLTWWHAALSALGDKAVAGQPILEALRAEALTGRVAPTALASLVEAWELLLEDAPIDHARARGRALFAAAAAVLGADDPVEAAGEGWALADLALHSPDARVAAGAQASAGEVLQTAHQWSRAGRALGALTLVARADLAGTPVGSPGRILALVRMRLTGR